MKNATVTNGGLVLLTDIVAAQKDKIIKGQIELDPEKLKMLPDHN